MRRSVSVLAVLAVFGGSSLMATTAGAASPSASSKHASTGGVRQISRLVTAGRVSDVAAVPSGFAFVDTNARGRDALRVDTSRGVRTLFQGKSGGSIYGITANQRYLVWLYQETQQTAETTPVSWKIYLENLRTGKIRVVAQSKKPDPLPPKPILSGNRLAWDVYRGIRQQTSDIYLMRLPNGPTRTVVSNMRTDQIALAGQDLVYNKTTFTPPRTYRQHLIALDLTTGATHTLSAGGSPDGPMDYGNILFWRDDAPRGEGRFLNRKTGQTWTIPGGQGTAGIQGALALGAGFVAYVGETSHGDAAYVVEVRRYQHFKRVVDVSTRARSLCIPCGIGALGSHFVWGYTKGTHTVIALDQLS